MRAALFIMGCFLPLSVASAQTFGAITGEVKDPSGAVAPDATVTAANIATNVSRSTTSNQSGVYSFPDLIPATYRVTVSAAGFQNSTSTIEIQVQQTTRAVKRREKLLQICFAGLRLTYRITSCYPFGILHTDELFVECMHYG